MPLDELREADVIDCPTCETRVFVAVTQSRVGILDVKVDFEISDHDMPDGSPCFCHFPNGIESILRCTCCGKLVLVIKDPFEGKTGAVQRHRADCGTVCNGGRVTAQDRAAGVHGKVNKPCKACDEGRHP